MAFSNVSHPEDNNRAAQCQTLAIQINTDKIIDKHQHMHFFTFNTILV